MECCAGRQGQDEIRTMSEISKAGLQHPGQGQQTWEKGTFSVNN
ncbi:rCG53582 [Rattus norvegicus]|uniref:RCG53582 n=1 Tax=Rattus norvegicus TaxID=10116 RepID=A6JBD0_RAT|nr:rCG53582 [Rattus norvegicus]